MSIQELRVGFAGLGAMGAEMARNVKNFVSSNTTLHGNVLHVWNRDASKSATLSSSCGAAACDSLKELAAACDVIHMCLANDTALDAVVTGLLDGGLPAGSYLVDHSTVLPETTERMAAAAATQGVTYIAAPVFGRPDAAAAARLVIVASGDPEAIALLTPLLMSMGRKVMNLGPRLGAAHAMKLSGNFCIVSAIELLSQGMTLAEKSGVPRAAFMEWVTEFVVSPAIVGYGNRIAADDFGAGAGFTVELAQKDVGHMQRQAQVTGTHLPLADMAMSHLVQAKANGHGQMDWGAIALAVRQSSGLPQSIAQKAEAGIP